MIEIQEYKMIQRSAIVNVTYNSEFALSLQLRDIDDILFL